MAIQQKLIKYLNEILKHTHDGIKGYKDAARNIEEGSLKDFFIERAKEKIVLRDALNEEIYRLEGKPLEEGSFLNLFQRSWKNFKTSLDHDNQKEIAKYCLEAEKKATREFDILLRNPELVSETFYSLLEQQNEKNLAAIKALLERIKP
ncbi:PA2169 family four-helix-bundle protein [Cyclobacterium plantarum]|uniref:PA2169 family four-helix-bundle protein n=1 Tax=Cyclobacterium plantarum TaxID=2716263 RepID=UPI003F72F4F5